MIHLAKMLWETICGIPSSGDATYDQLMSSISDPSSPNTVINMTIKVNDEDGLIETHPNDSYNNSGSSLQSLTSCSHPALRPFG